MEQMKKIIEDKKKKGLQKGAVDGGSSKSNAALNSGMKSIKRTGGLNK